MAASRFRSRALLVLGLAVFQAAPALPAERPTISADPGTLVRWQAPGTKR
jgi:hypothetical protein